MRRWSSAFVYIWKWHNSVEKLSFDMKMQLNMLNIFFRASKVVSMFLFRLTLGSLILMWLYIFLCQFYSSCCILPATMRNLAHQSSQWLFKLRSNGPVEEESHLYFCKHAKIEILQTVRHKSWTCDDCFSFNEVGDKILIRSQNLESYSQLIIFWTAVIRTTLFNFSVVNFK